MRIHVSEQFAYITDSGTAAIIAADLDTGESRGLPGDHWSVKSEGVVPVISGREWTRADGSAAEVHFDGIALDNKGGYLCYHALTGKTLYRIETRRLRDWSLLEEQVAMKVESPGETAVCDGMICGPEGAVYLTATEESAIKKYPPSRAIETVMQDRPARPDTFAWGPDGYLHVTASQIHLMPDPGQPFLRFKILPKS